MSLVSHAHILNGRDVIALNADYQYLGMVRWKKAVKLLKLGKAESLFDGSVKLATDFFLPKVIRLLKAVRQFYGRAVKWNKANMLVRDAFTCQYCEKPVSKTTAEIEHVIPVSRGGKDGWQNTVISCRDCNQKKKDKLPKEAGMHLIRQPYAPTIMEFFHKKVELLGLTPVLKELGLA